ncbi:MAG: hypothetical protein AAF488_18145, partial [Planctomycetota bacterium]
GPVARAFRDALPTDVPVWAAGGMWTREDAHAAMAAGVDVPVLGRSAIVHPDWPSVSAEADWEPKRPIWRVADLHAAAVSPAFVEYLQRFPGLVEGGEPAREE